MQRPSQFTPQIRAGPGAGGQTTPEHEARERVRETAYRPDGSIAGVRERELWQIWRQPVAALLPGSSGLQSDGLWKGLVDLVLVFAGIHILLAVAVGTGALFHWIGWNPVLGYAVAWFLMWFLGIRRRL